MKTYFKAIIFLILISIFGSLTIYAQRYKGMTSVKVSAVEKSVIRNVKPSVIVKKIGVVSEVSGKLAAVQIFAQYPYGDGITIFYCCNLKGAACALLSFTGVEYRNIYSMSIDEGECQSGDFVFAKFIPNEK